jgi:hypothetical protein
LESCLVERVTVLGFAAAVAGALEAVVAAFAIVSS